MKIRRVSGGTKTVASTNAPLPQAYHQGWDAKPGLEQTRAHIATREGQGQKMTPKGPGKLKAK